MKKALLYTLVFATMAGHPNTARGQFDALPDSDAVWVHHSFDPWTIDWRIAYCLAPIYQDTLINDTLYNVLLECDPWTGYPSVYHGGLYDNGLGQVYFYHHNAAHADLLYDFDVLPGDSVEVALGGGFPFTMYIATVDTVNIAGSSRKRIGVQSEAAILGGQGVVHWWIQGIGGTNGLLETDGNLVLDVVRGLECMSASDTVWWSWEPNGTPGDCFSVGLPEVDVKLGTMVVPNPSTGIFQFTGTPPTAIHILDTQGRTLFTTNKTEVDLSAYPVGCYRAVVVSESGKSSLPLVVVR